MTMLGSGRVMTFLSPSLVTKHVRHPASIFAGGQDGSHTYCNSNAPKCHINATWNEDQVNTVT
uniref:Uncharacterized protein n=1 Tax=Oryza barthii TaxID=65489 RepID=A0A0D3GSE0_9ORYZ